MQALKANIKQLQALIERNRLEQVFEKLAEWGRYSEYQITVSLLLSDYNAIKEEALRRTITNEEERVRLIQIKQSLLRLLNHIRDTGIGEVERGEAQELVQIVLAKNEAEFQRLLEHKLGQRYTNLRHLSSGDNAIIYSADQVDPVTKLARKVAIKVIKPLSVIDDENMENIREDLSKAKRLSGVDGMISIIDEGLDAPPRYIVTEYVDGMRLSDRLAKGWPYQLREIKDMLYTMARALAQGHADGLVHNNLWPSNILIDKNRGPRMSPFQVVRASYYKRSFERIQLFSMYWSPEQINSDQATALSDQYSFGLIAYELFRGEAFFSGKTILDILRRRLAFDEDPGLLVRELKATLCPPDFVQAIARMLSSNPAHRFMDMDEVVDVIQYLPVGGELMERQSDYPLVRRLRNAYSRCRRREDFYAAFYEKYLTEAPHAREIFDRAWSARMAKHGYTEDRIWRFQHRMVDLAVERLLQFPSISTAMNNRLSQLAQQHAAVGVLPEDYGLFLDKLRDTIWDFDQAYWTNKAELDQAWEAVTQESLKRLSRR